MVAYLDSPYSKGNILMANRVRFASCAYILLLWGQYGGKRNHQRGTDTVELNYGNSSVRLELNDASYDWISYEDGPAASAELIEQALDRPIGSPPLEQLAQGRANAVILISDISRLCPSYMFLERLIARLNRGGIQDDQIKIIVALGAHRKQSEAELIRLTGEAVYRRVQVLNHSARSEDCVYVGTTSHGTIIEINREVVNADLLIATGNIEPHRLVGMSGGSKALMPGVASVRSIERHHALSQSHQVVPGNPINALHKDIEEAARFVPIHFLFNVIVNHRREVIEAVCGDPLAAHQVGMNKAKQRFVIEVDKKYDLVIVSPGGHPKDTQLYQTVKTMQNASVITKQGGTILCVARCEEIYGNGVLQQWMDTIQDQELIVEMLKQRFVLGAHKLQAIHELNQKHTICLFSDIPSPIVSLAGFTPVEDLQQFVSELLQRPSIKNVAIMPFGSITFPAEGERTADLSIPASESTLLSTYR